MSKISSMLWTLFLFFIAAMVISSYMKIEGFDVEVYVETYGEAHYSSGVYSVKNNRWVKEPSKTTSTIDLHLIKVKADAVANSIKHVKELIDFIEASKRSIIKRPYERAASDAS